MTVVAAAAMASCGRRGKDPCAPTTFSEQFCQDAVRSGGYFWNGTWYPMVYSNPYPYYYDSYRTFRSNGGQTSPAPAITYGRPGGVERGGFGSTGDGHGSGGEGHGSGSGE